MEAMVHTEMLMEGNRKSLPAMFMQSHYSHILLS